MAVDSWIELCRRHRVPEWGNVRQMLSRPGQTVRSHRAITICEYQIVGALDYLVYYGPDSPKTKGTCDDRLTFVAHPIEDFIRQGRCASIVAGVVYPKSH